MNRIGKEGLWLKNHGQHLNDIIPALPERVAGEPGGQDEGMLFEESRERAWRRGVVVLVLVLSDLLFALIAWGVAFLLASAVWESWLLPEINLYFMGVSTAAWIGMRWLWGLYPGYGLTTPDELRRQTHATLTTLAVTTLFAFAFQSGGQLSRLLIGISFLERLLVTPLVRHFTKWALMKVGLWGKPVVVFGAGGTGKRLLRVLEEEWSLGLRPVSFLDFSQPMQEEKLLKGTPYERQVADARHRNVLQRLPQAPYIGSVGTLLRQTKKQGIDTVIFAMPSIHREELGRFLGFAARWLKHVVVIPDLGEVTSSAVTARNLGGLFGVEIKHNLLDPWALRIKRSLDLVAVIAGGIIVAPLLAVISLAVWADSGGAVLYWAERMGKDEKPFLCLKFRTMVPEAEAKLNQVLQEDAKAREEYLKYHKLRDDPRITRVGRILRKTSLDELPQIWNVLRGEMSLVGPRPYLPRESEEIGGAQEEILRVPPGITGPWQVAGRNHTSFKERVLMDASYVRNWSVWLDLILLARTLVVLVFRRTTAY